MTARATAGTAAFLIALATATAPAAALSVGAPAARTASATGTAPAPAPAPVSVSTSPEAAAGQPGAEQVPAASAVPAGEKAPTTPPSGISANAWLVADATSGAILAAHNPDLADLPASTMKILTALAVLPDLPPDREVVVSDEAARVDGTRVGLVPGVRYSVRDLATAMLIASGNDATVALVDAAGGRHSVLARMNRLAADLGARDTVAGDPTGLDAPGQRTTVHDLAVLGRAALDEPVVRGYLTIPRASLPGRNGERFEIANHNTLMGSYEGTVGIKNGYTVAAGATFVGAATRGGRTLIVSLLRTAPAYGVDAKALLDWGFAHAADVRPLGRLAGPPEAAPVPDGVAAAADDAGRTSAGSAATAGGEDGGRDSDQGGTSGAGAHGDAADGTDSTDSTDSGIGAVTWTALAITIAVSLLTLIRRSRRHSGRPGQVPRQAGRHAGRHARHARHSAGRGTGPAAPREQAPYPQFTDDDLRGYPARPPRPSAPARRAARTSRSTGTYASIGSGDHGDQGERGDRAPRGAGTDIRGVRTDVREVRTNVRGGSRPSDQRLRGLAADDGPAGGRRPRGLDSDWRGGGPRAYSRLPAHPRADGHRHLVALPSLPPEQEADELRRMETPPFGTVRSPAP